MWEGPGRGTEKMSGAGGRKEYASSRERKPVSWEKVEGCNMCHAKGGLARKKSFDKFIIFWKFQQYPKKG